MAEFVPPDFEVPLGLETSEFVLEPLGPEHNERDYDAWTSSMGHIAATAGYPDGSWPREMTRDENRVDLQRHADDFRTRKGFTYTVLDPASRDVIGCVYIYPLPDSVRQRRVRAPHVGPAKQPSRWDRFEGHSRTLAQGRLLSCGKPGRGGYCARATWTRSRGTLWWCAVDGAGAFSTRGRGRA